MQDIQALQYVTISHRTTTTIQKLYAKAIYENIADSPDELAFKKGDTLNVIEQDTDGLDGWWLCSLRGRQGICPGNRLRIISSYDSGCFSPSPSSSPCPSSLGASTVTLNSSILSTSDIYENSGFHSSGQLSLYSNDSGNSSNGGGNIYNNNINSNYNRQGKRRSWHTTPHKVITPQKCGDIYLYDILPLSSLNRNNSPYQNHYQNLSTIIMSSNMDPDTYDTPKPATPINCDVPKHPSWSSNLKSPNINNNNNNNKQNEPTTPTTPRQQQQQIHQQNDDSYDIPRPINLLHQQNMTPSSSNSSLSFSLSLSSSNRSSLANMPDYDIPRRNPIRQLTEQQQQQQSTYDFPQPQTPQQFIEKQPPSSLVIMTKELPLELSSALETLATLQIEGTAAVSRLLAFVTPNWRNREKLEPILMDIKLAAVRLKTALHDLTEFCDGALGNANRSDDKHLNLKLRPLVKALRDADKLIHDASHKIESQGWTVDNLARENQKNSHSPDSLDQMIACAQTLTEDVRQSASFIQGNASLLFKRIPSSTSVTTTPTTNTTPIISNNNSNDLTQDYDYVCFDTKESLSSSAKLNATNEMILLQNIKENRNLDKIELDNNDKLLVKYYALQISTHMGYLTQAIDSFLETVEKNQPPKFFIAYGKFVVLSAHNLVSIGDIVHRNINKNDLKQRIEQSTDSLADALKSCVIKSKKAAQHFPSVQAVQEMVDSVVDISHLASDLKISMLQAVHF